MYTHVRKEKDLEYEQLANAEKMTFRVTPTALKKLENAGQSDKKT